MNKPADEMKPTYMVHLGICTIIALVLICLFSPSSFAAHQGIILPEYTVEFLLPAFKLKIEEVSFTSDQPINGVSDPVWTGVGVNNPVCYIKSSSLSMNAKFSVTPPLTTPAKVSIKVQGLGFSAQINDVSVSGNHLDLNNIVLNEHLYNEVGTLSRTWEWYFMPSGGTKWLNAGISGPHRVFIVYNAPFGSTVTEKRLDWVCRNAYGAKTLSGVADAIHRWLGDSDPPYEPKDRPSLETGWALLENSNAYGMCDQQAELMRLAMGMLGIDGSVALVRASTNAGAGNCLDYEWRECAVHGYEKLNLDFYGGGRPDNMNQWEGACNTAGAFYAVWPKLKATNDYTMLKTLGTSGVTQRYCTYDPDRGGYWKPCDQANATPSIP